MDREVEKSRGVRNLFVAAALSTRASTLSASYPSLIAGLTGSTESTEAIAPSVETQPHAFHRGGEGAR